MSRFLFIIIVLLTVFSCTSTKQFNAHIERELSVKDQLKDLNFIERKLIKNHSKLDLYLSQSEINFKFDSLRQRINVPLKPNDFFLKVNSVIAQFRHGHTDIYPLFKRISHKEEKRIKNSTGPLSQLTTFWVNDSLYIINTSINDSLLKKGSVILAIDGITPSQIKSKYQKVIYGDGFNTTYFNNRLNRSFFSQYYLLENGLKDTLQLSIYNKNEFKKLEIKRLFKSKEKKKLPAVKNKNQLKVKSKPTEKPVQLKTFYFSLNKKTKTYSRILSFPTNDSTFAVLKINTFSFGKFKKDYQSIFKIIKDYNVKNLVLDLRNNGGGRLADANQLFTYLQTDQIEFLGSQIVKSPSVMQRTMVNLSPTIVKPIMYPFSFISYLLINKSSTNEYQIKPALSRIKNKYPTTVYQGNLYVIINGGSYSASTMIAANLQGLNRAYFVGEETGGDANGTVAGLIPTYKLPNSKLKLSIGTIYLTPNYYKTETIGRGIFPHKEIKTTLQDALKNIDSQLRWIIQDVKEDNKALKEQLNYLPE